MNDEHQEFEPVVVELPTEVDPLFVFERLRKLPNCLFLDSALAHESLGRYSFVVADPIDWLQIAPTSAPIFPELTPYFSYYTQATHKELPPFQGGAAGLLSYDLSKSIESIRDNAYSEFDLPAMAIGIYDVVFAFDHLKNCGWLISQGYEKLSGTNRPSFSDRKLLAQQRADRFREVLSDRVFDKPSRRHARIPLQGPTYETTGPNGLVSNFAEHEYLQTIQRGIDYIYAGDVFQVNLAQRLCFPAQCESHELYDRLRTRNPATFAGYFDLGDYQIISASPERFLQVQDRQVEARPIKGTRRRTSLPEADLFAGSELRESEKDTAENVMIVDLMRNDLSVSCTPESIVVDQLCKVEVYEFVQHLVSSVRGTMRDDCSLLDLLQGTFPGGSITGAPKIRAMEIIAELEPHARGAYCGSLGYLGFDGSMDMSILIRTVTAGKGWWQFPVGGGIVAQSNPEQEYMETWHKAEGIIRSLERS